MPRQSWLRRQKLLSNFVASSVQSDEFYRINAKLHKNPWGPQFSTENFAKFRRQFRKFWSSLWNGKIVKILALIADE